MARFISKKILTEKTLGEKLRAFRKRKHLSLEQAEEETKVRVKYLDALERGSYGELPADVYVLGFLAKYAEFLGAPKEELIDCFHHERGTNNLPKNIAPEVQIKERKAYLTPRIIVLILVFLGIVGFLGYIFYAIKNFTAPPNLEIRSPSAETVIHQDRVEVIGKTDEGSSLKINDQVVFLDDKGNFKETVKLQTGLNNIEIRATNRVQKETVKVIKILAEY
ncbi:MAG: helix-turn-helix domain-containing protein [Patescibacteria group bacterium]